MKVRILESVKWEVSDEDIKKSKEAKKCLTDKLRESPVIEARKHELNEERWKAKDALEKATFLDEKEEMTRLRDGMTKSRHALGDLESTYNKECSGLRNELYKTNSSVRKTLVEILDKLYHGKELKVGWDLKGIDTYWKDTKNDGIVTFPMYKVKTNEDAIFSIKEEIREFIKEAGAVTSSSNRDHWVSGDAGSLRELSIDEILKEVQKFEERISAYDPQAMVEKEIDQGQLEHLKRAEAAGN